MLVAQKDFDNVVKKLNSYDFISLDTETTGLYPWRKDGDRLFCIVIGCKDGAYYFNFNDKPDHLNTPLVHCLPKRFICKMKSFLVGKTIFMHNAKYDLAMLHFAGLKVINEPRTTVHCTAAIGRVLKNDLMNLTLATMTKAIGEFKSDRVTEYIKANGLNEKFTKPGKKTTDNHPRYDLVPLDIMIKYAEQDAMGTFKLGIHQIETIVKKSNAIPAGKPTILDVFYNEIALTRVLFNMEVTGIKIDSDFVEKARDYEWNRKEGLEEEFRLKTGCQSITSKKDLVAAFDLLGERYPKTEKGNPSFTDEVLENMSSPIAQLVRDYRDAESKANKYYGNILWLQDSRGVVHANIKQGGTKNGRMAYSNPNLQNQKRVEKGHPDYSDKYLVRRSFVPREGFFLLMLDYDQMEYKLMLDYAKEESIIEQVLNGVDIHQATANMMEVPRSEAKTINFMLLYGGGIAKLAMALFDVKIPENELKAIQKLIFWESHNVESVSRLLNMAREEVAHHIEQLEKSMNIKKLYFSRLPEIEKFIKKVKFTAESRGFIYNWFGRRYHFNRKTSYKAPNYLIAGGCADIVKIAMNRIDSLLASKNSRMLIQVHDELVFEIDYKEQDIIPELKSIMENIYPYKKLPLTCGAEYSEKSWQDKIAWKGAI